ADRADQAAGRGYRLDLLVGDVARRGMNAERTGMREDGGSRRPLDGVHGGAKARVRTVDHHAGLVQALDDVDAEPAEPGIGAFLAAVADPVLHVVSQLDHADADALVGVDQVETVLDRIGALKVEDDAQSSVALGGVYVVSATNQAETLRGIYLPGPQAQGAKRRFGVVPSADRGGHRRRPAAPVQVEMARLHQQGTNRVDDD